MNNINNELQFLLDLGSYNLVDLRCHQRQLDLRRPCDIQGSQFHHDIGMSSFPAKSYAFQTSTLISDMDNLYVRGLFKRILCKRDKFTI